MGLSERIGLRVVQADRVWGTLLAAGYKEKVCKLIRFRVVPADKV